MIQSTVQYILGVCVQLSSYPSSKVNAPVTVAWFLQLPVVSSGTQVRNQQLFNTASYLVRKVIVLKEFLSSRLIEILKIVSIFSTEGLRYVSCGRYLLRSQAKFFSESFIPLNLGTQFMNVPSNCPLEVLLHFIERKFKQEF